MISLWGDPEMHPLLAGGADWQVFFFLKGHSLPSIRTYLDVYYKVLKAKYN